MTTTTNGFKVIGTRPIRHDGVDKVTGRAIYGADVQMAGLLAWPHPAQSHAHARIRGIDAGKALALPGVEAIVTAADFPDPGDRIAELGEGAINLKHLSSNCLARDKVLYKGQAVAAVAAASPHIAEEALKLIEVDYEPLPPVLDVRAAMQRRRPLLHDDCVTESLGQADRQALEHRQAHPVQARRHRARVLQAAGRASSASSTRRRCIRATSSRTTRRPCGTPTAR